MSRVVVCDGVVIASTNSDQDKAELDDLWQRAAGDVLGTGRGPVRISLSARFSLEKATAFLGEEFSRVETDRTARQITVQDPEPVIAHMASYRAWADQPDVPFEATIEGPHDPRRSHRPTRHLRGQVSRRHPRLPSLRADLAIAVGRVPQAARSPAWAWPVVWASQVR